MPDKKKTAQKVRRTFKHTPTRSKPKSPKAKKAAKPEVKMEQGMVELMAMGETSNLVEQSEIDDKEKQSEEQSEVETTIQTTPESAETIAKTEPASEEKYPADKQVQDQVEQKEVDDRVDEELGEEPQVEEKKEPNEINLDQMEDVTVVEEGGGLKWLLILVILFLVGMIGGLGYLFAFQNQSAPVLRSSVLKTVKVFNISPTPKAIAKNSYTIEVLNGSGVAGDAAAGQTFLSSKGYNVKSIGNADNSNYTQTIIKAKSNVSSNFIASLRGELSSKYTVASSLTPLASSSATDVVVIIGSQ